METNPQQPAVFVLVPSYNHERYIEQCLESIFKQTLRPSKLLVIDDGSTDGSIARIEAALKHCPFDAELRARENKGLCATLNEGLADAGGDYFAYLGSDDLWAPSFLEKRVDTLNRRPSAVLGYGNAFLVDDNGDISDSSDHHSHDWGFFPDGDPWPMLSFGTSPVSSTVVYRREALSGLQWNTTARLEDYEMYLRVSRKGEFAFDPAILSAWRRHGTNTSADSQFMLDEIIGAIGRAEEANVLTAAQGGDARRRTKFRFAREALQRGDKSRAAELARESYLGARSSAELLRFGLRMLTPMSIVRVRRKLLSTAVKTNIREVF